MELLSLLYFREVARLENMSRAAEKLHISQPALSKSISQFEASLGVELFDHNGRSIKLNRYGHFFLKRVERILYDYDQAREDLLSLVSPGHGEVSIGFMHTLGLQVIPSLMNDIRTVYPNMQFQLTQSNTGVLLEKLEKREIDICLISSLNYKSSIYWEKLWEEELFLIVPEGDMLAEKERVKVKDFAARPFISIKKGNSLRKSVDDLYRQEGFELNVAFEGEEVHTLAGLVESGLGISLIPVIKGIDQYKVRVIPVDAENCKREVGFAHVNNQLLSTTTKQFIAFIKEYFKWNG
ncbi:LysR family transcriptional regulator [Solibacillus daqui]|uniref:LysR family transcriptional regulator n=1 Tax=Solibacillus daqui TaxID=2912187 RepID=UPI002366F8EF|nr:LysR family transcriptional regulator [Solibacillus daqui]